MEQFLTQVMPYLITVIGAVASYLCAYWKTKQTRSEIEELNAKIKSGNYYVICPKCGTRIFLAEIEMHEVKPDGDIT